MANNKTAQYGDYTISIEDSGAVKVTLNGSECKNTIAALRDIAKDVNFTLDDKWNTRQAGKNLIDYLKENIRLEILSIMKLIASDIRKETSNEVFTYNQQRAMINSTFQMGDYNIGSIMLRLIVIDSLYSTNASYSYFSFEDIAKEIYALGKKQHKAEDYFYSLLTNKNNNKLFNKKYGIRKTLADGSKQVSLISKYAYYQLLQNPQKHPLGFPIYDSLALKMYPVICKALEIPQRDKSEITISANNDTPNICDYISALNKLREKLFENSTNLFENLQQFDILDAYLWRMGKINEGNFSLLLSKEDYRQFINNLDLGNTSTEDLFNKYHNTNLISFAKTNKGNKYKYDFNSLVRYEIKQRATQDIVNNLSNHNYISALINHWKSIIKF